MFLGLAIETGEAVKIIRDLRAGSAGVPACPRRTEPSGIHHRPKLWATHDQGSARRGQAGTPALPAPRSLIIFTASTVWGIRFCAKLPIRTRKMKLSTLRFTYPVSRNPNHNWCPICF